MTVVGLLVATASPSVASTQGRLQWSARYDGPAHGDDADNTAVLSPDGSMLFLFGLSAGSNGLFDYATVAYRTDTGAQVWAARYDGPGHDDDQGQMIRMSSDGSTVFVTGWSVGDGTGEDYATIAYDAASGTQLWLERWDGPAHLDDFALSMVVTADGSQVVVSGGSGVQAGVNDYVTVAYSAVDGTPLWLSRYDGPAKGDDWSNSSGIGPDGRIYVTGRSMSKKTGYDIATVAYQPSDGKRLWVARFDGSGHAMDNTCLWTCVETSPDGSVVYVFGQTFTGAGLDVVALANDAHTGARLWAAVWDGPSHLLDVPADLAVTPDGSQVAVAGITGTPSMKSDAYVVAFATSDGSQRWQSIYDGSSHGNDGVSTIVAAPNGKTFVMTGSSNNDGTSSTAGRDVITIEYATSNGKQKWAARYDGRAHGEDDGTFVLLSPDGSVAYTTGDTTAKHGLDYVTLTYRVS